MLDREKVISKLEKEVQRTYSIKTTVFQNGEKVSEEINTHREPCVMIPIEMADEILALLKEQDAKIEQLKRFVKGFNPIARCKDCKHYHKGFNCDLLQKPILKDDDWFCADGERRI